MIGVAGQRGLDDVVSVHLDAFPGYFMAQLGPWFLREYYRCIVEYPRGVLLTEYGDRGCVGIVAGFIDPASFYYELRRRRVHLALAAGAGVVARPLRLLTLLRDYRRVGGAARQALDPGTAELSSLAVRPSAAGQGVGTRLVRRFIAAAESFCAKRVTLTTDTIENDAVQRFYRGLGFTAVRTFEARRGRMLEEFVINIGKG